MTLGAPLLSDHARERRTAGEAYFAAQAEPIARLCHAAAVRFARGGRLMAFGSTPQGRSDARHVAVEFVHPVIVGKRALPALAVVPDGGALAGQAALLCERDDIALGFEGDEAAEALEVARRRGCLTVAFDGATAEWDLTPPAPDAFVRQELAETAYHVLWELIHVFLDRRGLLEGRESRALTDAGASSFLYPFLAEQEDDLDAVVDDVRRSVLMKADEVASLREQTLRDGAAELAGAARALRAAFDAGGRLLAFGNGGSATDAMDVVADFRFPPEGLPARPALDLGEDTAILTALANDIGADVVFARQIIAHGREDDVALAISTSGGSPNVLRALEEARRRGLVTIALAGYDGGRIAGDALADHVVVSRSQHIPRVQEAQATAYHVLRRLVELSP